MSASANVKPSSCSSLSHTKSLSRRSRRSAASFSSATDIRIESRRSVARVVSICSSSRCRPPSDFFAASSATDAAYESTASTANAPTSTTARLTAAAASVTIAASSDTSKSAASRSSASSSSSSSSSAPSCASSCVSSTSTSAFEPHKPDHARPPSRWRAEILSARAAAFALFRSSFANARSSFALAFSSSRLSFTMDRAAARFSNFHDRRSSQLLRSPADSSFCCLQSERWAA
mmetsp:Transcript_23362/g.50426  ORF Transcript_23362/g.50426 Transcript_23362/m.50426 type:complete len:234 (-) Transcript_23362:636-1337(-)